MLLNYHSFYEQPALAPVIWVPPRVRKPQRRVRPEPEPERQIIHASMDCQLPMLEVEIEATASTIRPTDIRDIDLDAQEDGWTDELLLLAAARFLLDEYDDD